jgi:hypothetical protein
MFVGLKFYFEMNLATTVYFTVMKVPGYGNLIFFKKKKIELLPERLL